MPRGVLFVSVLRCSGAEWWSIDGESHCRADGRRRYPVIGFLAAENRYFKALPMSKDGFCGLPLGLVVHAQEHSTLNTLPQSLRGMNDASQLA